LRAATAAVVAPRGAGTRPRCENESRYAHLIRPNVVVKRTRAPAFCAARFPLLLSSAVQSYVKIIYFARRT